jgi:hypothetical protein
VDLSSEPVPLTVCESCAGEDDELVWVWPLPADSSEGPELWCSDCRDRFPYEEADEREGAGDG